MNLDNASECVIYQQGSRGMFAKTITCGITISSHCVFKTTNCITCMKSSHENFFRIAGFDNDRIAHGNLTKNLLGNTVQCDYPYIWSITHHTFNILLKLGINTVTGYDRNRECLSNICNSAVFINYN